MPAGSPASSAAPDIPRAGTASGRTPRVPYRRGGDPCSRTSTGAPGVGGVGGGGGGVDGWDG